MQIEWLMTFQKMPEGQAYIFSIKVDEITQAKLLAEDNLKKREEYNFLKCP